MPSCRAPILHRRRDGRRQPRQRRAPVRMRSRRLRRALLFDLQGSLEGSDGDYENALCRARGGCGAAVSMSCPMPTTTPSTIRSSPTSGSGNLDRVRAAFRYHRDRLKASLTLKPLADLAWGTGVGVRRDSNRLPRSGPSRREGRDLAWPPPTTSTACCSTNTRSVPQRTATVANETDDGGNWIVDNDSGNPEEPDHGLCEIPGAAGRQGGGDADVLPAPTSMPPAAMASCDAADPGQADRPARQRAERRSPLSRCHHHVPQRRALGAESRQRRVVQESAMRTQFKPPKRDLPFPARSRAAASRDQRTAR